MGSQVPSRNIFPTPNVTELCILTDTPYKERFCLKEYRRMAEKLSKMGPDK